MNDVSDAIDNLDTGVSMLDTESEKRKAEFETDNLDAGLRNPSKKVRSDSSNESCATRNIENEKEHLALAMNDDSEIQYTRNNRP